MTAQRILFPLILFATMSFIISGITTFKAVGPVQNFFSLWISAWGIAWIFAFPSMLICTPVAQKLATSYLRKLKKYICKLKRTKLAVICGYPALVFFYNISNIERQDVSLKKNKNAGSGS